MSVFLKDSRGFRKRTYLKGRESGTHKPRLRGWREKVVPRATYLSLGSPPNPAHQRLSSELWWLRKEETAY